jgi:hypothetical protein
MDWLLLALLAVLVGSVGFTLGAWWGARSRDLLDQRRSGRPVEIWGPEVWPPV